MSGKRCLGRGTACTFFDFLIFYTSCVMDDNKVQRLILTIFFRRPGILVLINDADWELEGELEYEIRDRDEIVFISTLHGG